MKDKDEYIPLTLKGKIVMLKAIVISVMVWFALISYVLGIIFYYFACVVFVTAIYIYNDRKNQKKLKSLNFFKSK